MSGRVNKCSYFFWLYFKKRFSCDNSYASTLLYFWLHSYLQVIKNILVIVRSNNQTFARNQRFVVVVACNRLEAFLNRDFKVSQRNFVINNKCVSKYTACSWKGLSILAWAINTCKHWRITIITDTTEVPLNSFKKLKCSSTLIRMFLVFFKTTYGVV